MHVALAGQAVYICCGRAAPHDRLLIFPAADKYTSGAVPDQSSGFGHTAPTCTAGHEGYASHRPSGSSTAFCRKHGGQGKL